MKLTQNIEWLRFQEVDFMVFFPTEEMKELDKIFRPYMDGAKLRKDAPKEVVEAHNRYFELFRKQHEEEVKSWFE